jgi:hypothetical protein
MAGRRGSLGFFRALLAVAVVLVLLAVAADRALAWYFEQETETAIESGGARGAQVTIHGFPFLTQLASGSINHVTGQIDSGRFGGYDVADVSIDAVDVDPQDPYVARSVRADGLLGLGPVQEAMSEAVGADVQVEQASDDSTPGGALALTVPVGGLDLTATVTPTATDGSTLGIDVQEVALGGASVAVDALPGAVADVLTGIQVPLDLPEGVSLAGTSVEPGGLRIELDAVDFALAELAATAGQASDAGAGAP